MKKTLTETAMPTAAKKTRLESLDALRGFDMLWIIGLDRLIRVSADSFQSQWLEIFARQVRHPKWEGLTCYDLIFPLFLFIVGVAIPFSLASRSQQAAPRWHIYFRIFRRAALLILLGIVYNGALTFSGWENTRFASVLGLIGIGYMFASLIVMNCGIRGQLLWFFGILLGYWALLMWVPVPGYGAGVLTPEGCLSAYIDQHLLPGRLHGKTFDPEGVMPCISGICMAMAGAMTGQWLRRENVTPQRKAAMMFLAGVVAVLVGLVWSSFLPFIKNIWTGSFVVFAIGVSLLLLGLFYLIIDVFGWKEWAFVFTVIGMNSITIYVGVCFIDFAYTANFFFGGLIKMVPEPYHKSLLITTVLIVEWLLLYALYRKKIFLRL